LAQAAGNARSPYFIGISAISAAADATLIHIYPELASCFNRFPEHRNPM
jgi:hypothetical protein